MSLEVALITVSYNSEADIRKHWGGARELSAKWYVIDNASTDESAHVAERLGARVVRSEENLGFAGANNVGVMHADADCYIFVNPDVVVTEGDITVLAQAAIDNRAVMAPQLLNPDGSPQENGRQAPYLYRKFLHFLGRRTSRQDYEIIAAENEIVEASWVIGAAVAVPDDVFRAISGWDSSFFVYYEDADLCLRARTQGYPVLVHGGVRWVHSWARATRRSVSWRAWKLEASSATRFYRRYPRLLLHPRMLRRRQVGYTGDY